MPCSPIISFGEHLQSQSRMLLEKVASFSYIVLKFVAEEEEEEEAAMPESPVRCRVRSTYMTQDEKNQIGFLHRNVVTRDDTTDDPTACVVEEPFRIGNVEYSVTLVNGATPKYRNIDATASSRVRLEDFLGRFHTLKAAGGFEAPMDMNPVERKRREIAYYKNRAVVEMAESLAMANNPNIPLALLVNRGLICDLHVF